MNAITVTGRLVNQPARRETAKGVVTCFRVAVDGRPRLYLDIETWGTTAGHAAQHLTTGRHVAITGQLRQNEYHDRDGNHHTRYLINTDRITYLDTPCDTHAGAPHHDASPR